MTIATMNYVISRSGANLNLDDGTTYSIEDWYVPETNWRRDAITGRYQAGERLRLAVPEAQVIGARVIVMGDSWSEVDAAENEMRLALQQFSYTTTITTASVVLTYTQCQPADIRPVEGERRSGDVAACIALFDIDIRCTPLIGSEA